MTKGLALLFSSMAAVAMLVGAAQAAQPTEQAAGDGLCTVNVTVPPPSGPPPNFDALFGRPDPQAERPRLVKLKNDVYVIQNAQNVPSQIGQFGGNIAIYLTDDGVILFDSKTDAMHEDVVAKVRSLTEKPIKYVVVTHNHSDHAGGVAKMQQAGATVIMSRDDGRALAASSPDAPVPQETYSNARDLTLGGKKVQLTEHCGHTRGDTVAYLPAARVVIAGDLVTTPDSIPTIVSYQDGGNWTDLGKTLDVIAKMDFDILVGGHGPALTKSEFLKYRDRVGRIRERARALVREGKSREEFTKALVSEFNYGTGPAALNIQGMMAELH